MALTKVSSYAGEASADYMRKTFAAANSLLENIFVVKERISRPWKIRRLTSDGIIQSPGCDFTDTGDVDIDERVLTTADIGVNLELCKQSFKGDWDELTMGAGALNKTLPRSVTDAMIAEITDQVGQDLERQIWEGDSSGTDQIDGIVTLLLADAENTPIAGTLGEYATDPIATLKRIKDDAIANKIAAKPDAVIVMSMTNLDLYMNDLRSTGSGQENVSGQVSMSYNGVPIHGTYGIADNHIIMAEKSKLYFGTDLRSDLNQVVLLDMTPYDGSKNVRFIQEVTAGVQYAFGGEISFYNEALV